MRSRGDSRRARRWASCTPRPGTLGSPGSAAAIPCTPRTPRGCSNLCNTFEIDLVVVGPEAPLVAGVADQLRHAGIAVFGPGAGAARIEGSKTFAKDVMAAAGVPVARTLETPRAPCVVKADGLAAGKGVFMCRTGEELEAGLRAAAALGETVVVEEWLEGEEVSVLAIVSGEEALPLPAARDHKRIGDGDTGPNTGGMGAFSPVGGVSAGEIVDAVHRPVAAELARRGTPFVGVLFAGLMLTDDGPKVLEFNCRLGDPEAQAILPLLEGDVLEAFAAAAGGSALGGLAVEDRAAVTVVLAAGSYPEGGDHGTAIEGIEDAEAEGALVFHAGTARHEGSLVTHGGRILNVTGLGADVAEARDRAYAAAGLISFDGMRYRRDIALEAARV